MHKRAIGPLTATPCMQSGGTLQFSLQRLSEIEYYMLSKDKIDFNNLMGFTRKKVQTVSRFFPAVSESALHSALLYVWEISQVVHICKVMAL
jgi:hypothetical protein